MTQEHTPVTQPVQETQDTALQSLGIWTQVKCNLKVLKRRQGISREVVAGAERAEYNEREKLYNDACQWLKAQGKLGGES